MHEGFEATGDGPGDVKHGGAAGLLEGVAARKGFPADPVEVGRRVGRGGSRTGKKPGEASPERLDLAPVPIASAEARIEHPIGRQAAHFDEPIGDGTLAADGEFVLVDRQRQHTKIDAARQTAVEAHLQLGIATPGSQCRQIDAVVAHRLLQLVNVVVGQEDPRKMGFDARDPRGSLRIRGGRAQKHNLAVDIDTLRRPQPPALPVAVTRRFRVRGRDRPPVRAAQR
jgi:hypothetical protein